MGLSDTFTDGVNTVFSVLSEVVQEASYIITDDDGWGNVTTTTHSVSVILDNFTQEDLKNSSFSDLIQHTDVKGMIKGEEITFDVSTKDVLSVDGRVFHIEGYEKDPFGALYTFILRDTV